MSDLVKRRMTFNDTTYPGGIMRIFGFKTQFHTENDIEMVTMNFAYFPCRRFCSICLESSTFCLDIIKDSITVTKQDFLNSLSRKRTSNTPLSAAPDRQRLRE